MKAQLEILKTCSLAKKNWKNKKDSVFERTFENKVHI
jgi:hypothetical protein